MKEYAGQNMEAESPAANPVPGARNSPVSSSELGLSAKQWLFTAVLVILLLATLPRLWHSLEAFDPGPDYRMPYALSDDYWLYSQYCRWAVDHCDVMVVGDSVAWGHYVPPDGSLPHYLNQMSGRRTFANLGIDGIHPAAMAGLLKYYGQAITDKTVLLSFNPLWMTSKKHDLQTDKEFRFNHPALVPQFTPKIACYRESLAGKINIVLERQVECLSWASHLSMAYLGKRDLTQWVLKHPYESPVDTLPFALPGPQETEEHKASWNVRSDAQQALPWVDLDTSVQWRCFRRAIRILRARGNRVFVLIGPFNEHLMEPESLEAYETIKAGVETWLLENGVPYMMPAPLPSELYADASHPLREGYALLAQWLFDDAAFQSAVLSSAEPVP